MKKYQDTATGQEWHFDDGVDIAALPNVPATLIENIITRPDEFHDWTGGGWTLNAARQKAAHNEIIKSKVAAIELLQVRPTRELLLDPVNAFAKNKLADLEAQIVALRAQLMP